MLSVDRFYRCSSNTIASSHQSCVGAFTSRPEVLMRTFVGVLTVSILLAPTLLAQNSPTAAVPNQAKPSSDVSFSADMLDKGIDPCNDFYAYACSKWKAQNPVPADRPGWGRFDELQQRGEYIVREILDKSSADKPGR